MRESGGSATGSGRLWSSLTQRMAAVGARLWPAERSIERSLPGIGAGAAYGGPRRLPAIVLTCDRYHPFAEHMMMRYQAEWPSHPFMFQVPYQRRALQGDWVASRRTPEAIRATVLELLEEFDDAAWVYWCIDDKYPISLVQPAVARLAEAVLSDRLPGVDGVIFCRCRKLLRPEFLLAEEREGPDGLVLLRRKDYSQIWIHQFLRVKVLRQLFRLLPEEIPIAKVMDALKDQISLPLGHRLYVVETNLAVFGESTVAGRITRNCASSLHALGLEMPPGFEETNQQVVMGTIERGAKS
jgi:hypothetical protein